MAQANSPTEILKLLEKSNCRECREPTCLAFASQVFKGRRRIGECPRLDPEKAARFESEAAEHEQIDVNRERDETAAALKKKAAEMDLAAAADRVGGRYENGRLKISVLGKEFAVDQDGVLHSQIHLHAWVAIPILNYVVHGEGLEPSGVWVPLRELSGGREYAGLFRQRVELPLKKVADEYTELFEDMIRIFNGRETDPVFDADISLVLHPLPKVPMLVSYRYPEDGLDSTLHLFFDSRAAANMGGIDAVYGLAAGLGMMFEKIAQTHSSA